jgi:hypothetical protein
MVYIRDKPSRVVDGLKGEEGECHVVAHGEAIDDTPKQRVRSVFISICHTRRKQYAKKMNSVGIP